MDTRNVIQYSLLIILFISSYVFYDKYFVEDNKKVDLNKSENIVKKKMLELIRSIKVKM